MNPRKRSHNHITTVQEHPSKRAKILSQIWHSQEETFPASSDSTYSASSTGTIHSIKGIIGERKGQYLVDWADDPITGQSYEPDWQPKSCLNAAAVKTWKVQRGRSTTEYPQASSKPRRIRRGRPRKSNNTSRPPRPQGTTQRTLSKFSNNKDSSRSSTRPESKQSQSNSLETSDISDLIVRVSQPSSLDRELYIAYESSLSTQNSTDLASQRSQFSLQTYSQPIHSTPIHSLETEDVVPDSQSIPGSSSYCPSADSSNNSRRLSAPRSIGKCKETSCHNRASARVSLHSASSDLVVSSTQESTSTSRRSRSAPVSSIPDSVASASSVRTLLSLPRSASDPGSIPHYLIGGRSYSQIGIPGSTGRSKSKSELNTQNCEEPSQKGSSVIEPAVSGSQPCFSGTDTSQPSRGGSGSPKTLAATEYCSQDHPSQATTTDESTLGELNPSFQRRRHSTPIFNRSQGSDKSILEVQDSQAPPLPYNFVVSHAPRKTSQLSPNIDSTMADSPVAMREFFDGSQDVPDTSTMSARERLKRRKALTTATLAQQRADREGTSPASQHSPLASRSPSHHISKTHSPSRAKSPAVVGKNAHRAPELIQCASSRTPEAEHSFVTIQSPLQQPRVLAAPLSPINQIPLQQAHSPETTISHPSKSPSVIPDRGPHPTQEEQSRLEAQPLEIETDVETPLPVHVSQAVPHTPMTPSKLSLHKEVSLSPSDHTLETCNLSSTEFVVPLSMPPRIQQQYCTTIRYHARTIKKFMEGKLCKRETIEQVNVLLDDVSKVTTHIDLQGSGPSSQEDIDPKHEAEYAESCSEKFVFLGVLLDAWATHDQEALIVIVARPGALQDIIETYLKAKEVSYRRPTALRKEEERKGKGHLHVTLLASGDARALEKTGFADLVIAFDETFNEHENIFLKTPVDGSNTKSLPTPVIRLVVYASLEHIDLCLPRSLEPIERLRRLVFPLLQTQKRVGALEFDEPRTKFCAGEVCSFLQESLVLKSGANWSLPPIRAIEGISFMESDSGLSDARSNSSDEFKPEGPIRYWPNPIPPKIKPSVERNGKRAFDLEWGDSLELQAKKQKLAQNYNAGHLEATPEDTPENLRKLLANTRSRLSAIESEFEKKATLANDLQRWAGVRQHHYEKLRKEHGDLRVSFTEATEMVSKSSLEIQDLKTKIATLNMTHAALKRELSSFQAQLESHANPAIAATALIAKQTRILESENASLKKRIASLTTDFEFTRQQYQQASTAAADSSAEIQILKPELEGLRRKNEANIAEYRRIRDEDENKAMRKEVQRLKATVKQRDAFIHKLEGENMEIKRGRAGVQTRGSSVQPKSPRAGSRGVSPAAGMLGPQGQALGHAMARGGSGLGTSRFSA